MINALEVHPDEEDSDDDIADVLRLVLEADPQVNADQIRVDCEDGVLKLDGGVPTEEMKRRAELDGWALYGIAGVENRLQVMD